MTQDFDRPVPPAWLDEEGRTALETLSGREPDRLRELAVHLGDLADWKEANAAVSPDDGDGVDYPEDVPERASVSVKEIAGTTYYYYQWREGDRIESKTIAQ